MGDWPSFVFALYSILRTNFNFVALSSHKNCNLYNYRKPKRSVDDFWIWICIASKQVIIELATTFSEKRIVFIREYFCKIFSQKNGISGKIKKCKQPRQCCQKFAPLKEGRKKLRKNSFYMRKAYPLVIYRILHFQSVVPSEQLKEIPKRSQKSIKTARSFVLKESLSGNITGDHTLHYALKLATISGEC